MDPRVKPEDDEQGVPEDDERGVPEDDEQDVPDDDERGVPDDDEQGVPGDDGTGARGSRLRRRDNRLVRPGHAVLTLAGIGRRFPGGTVALQGVSLRLADGDFVALLGPSGCGKSTLLRLIAGLDQPDSGTLRWDAGQPPAPGEIGYVFQDATLIPWATAADNIYLPLRLRGIPRNRAEPLIAQALAQVGLAGFGGARPRALSGGMRMRVSIARAVVTRPKVLLMDEPFAALDEFTRHRLQLDLLRLWQEVGCLIVFVTHSIYEAAFLARRIVLMTPRPGRIEREIASTLTHHAGTRLDPAYAALVAEVTRAMEQAMEQAPATA